MQTERSRGRLGPKRECELAELAEFVAETYCPNGKIDPEIIIRAKDIHLDYDEYGDAFDGMLECEDGLFFIHCNLSRENTPESARARFTLGHELAHYFIDEHRNALASGFVKPHPSFSDKGVGDLVVEREADFFASRLLIPEKRFRRALMARPFSLESVRAIAKEFDVSLTCTAIRFVTSEMAPSVVIKWSDQGFTWRWCSSQFWWFGYRRVASDMTSLPHDSATALCLAALSEGRQLTACNASTASAWFPSISERSNRNLILREEAMTLGKYGVLTFLTLQEGAFPDYLHRLDEE